MGSIVATGPQETAWRQVAPQNLVPGALILEGPNLYIPGHAPEYGPQGYMTLDFSDRHLNEVVHMPDGSIAYQRELV